MSATASDGFSRFETTTLLTAQEAEAAMKQAQPDRQDRIQAAKRLMGKPRCQLKADLRQRGSRE